MASKTYHYGESCSLTATANTGYSFVQWQDGEGTQLSTLNPYTFTVTESKTVNALFSLNSWTLAYSVSPVGGGTIACSIASGSSVNYGTSVTMTATSSNPGYHFLGWYDSNDQLVDSNATYTFTMPDNNVTLVAKFSQDVYTITSNASPAEGGSITIA